MAIRIPSPQEIGLQAPRADMPIASYTGGIAQAGAAAVGEAEERAGQQVSQTGLAIQNAQDQTDFATANAQFLQKKLALDQQFATDTDYTTKASRYATAITGVANDASNGIMSRDLRAQFVDRTMRWQEYGVSAMQAQAQRNKVDADRGALDNNLTGLSQVYQNADDPNMMASARTGITGLVNSAVAAGTITNVEGEKLLQTLPQQMAKQRVERLALNNPAGALDFLNKNQGMFDPGTALELQRGLKSHVEGQVATSYVNGLFGSSPAGNAGSPPTSLYDAITNQEGPGTSDKGAVAGVIPATFQRYAQPGESISNAGDVAAVRHRIIDDLWQKSGGDPARVAVGFFSGEGNMAPPGASTPYVEDRSDGHVSTSSYVTQVQARLDAAGGPRSGQMPSQYPDESALVQKIIHDFPDPDMQSKVLAQFGRQMSIIKSAEATDKADLEKSIPDIQSAALGGQDVTVPEASIRRLLPPAQAASTLENLQVAQQAGQVFKGIQWASPDQVHAAYADLSGGMGPISAGIKNKFGPPPGGTPDQESPEAYRLRTSILHMFDAQVKARDADLLKDPAGYVGNNPMVADKMKAVDPNDPSTFESYAVASLATQAQLGVAEGNRHVLTSDHAASMVKQLTSADPATTDVGAQIDGLAKSYGSMWPKAFGDLVTLGKLPPEYQVLGSMDAPEQQQARVDLNRALQATAKKGGTAQLEADAPPAEMATVRKNLDGYLDPFRQTASIPGISSNVGLISTVRDSIKQLATLYTIQGMDGDTALQKAADGILNEKYDFGSSSLGPSARVPKGTLPVVEAAAAGRLQALQTTDLMPFRSMGDTGTDQQRQADALKLVQSNSRWAPTEDDQGLFAYVRMNDGRNVPVKLNDGSRLELRFDSLPKAQSAAYVPSAAAAGVQ